MPKTKGAPRDYQALLTGVLLVGVIVLAARMMVADVRVYGGYAAAFLSHFSFPREYPPLSLIAMLLPEALVRWLHIPYQIAWLGISAGVLAILVRVVKQPLVLIALAITSGTLLGTYDLYPILAMVLAYLTIDKKPGLSWLLLGVSIALKLFPVLFIPLWWQRSRKGWAYGLIPLLTFYPPAMWSVLHYQFARQAEWESTVSLLSWIFGHSSMVLQLGYGSYEYFNGMSAAIGILLQVAFVGLFVWIAFLRRDLPLIERMILLLSFWFLTNKVLSVQYVFWVMFLAFLYGRHLWHWTVLGWATGIEFPLFTIFYAPLGEWLLSHRMPIVPMDIGMLLIGIRFAIWVWLLVRILRGHSTAQRTAQDEVSLAAPS